MSSLENDLVPQVRTMQIIVTAMCVAPLAFLIITQIIGDLGGGDNLEILTTITLGVGLVAMVLQGLLGRLVADQSAKAIADRVADQPEALGGAYMSGLVVSVAVCEAAAFLNLIAYAFQQSTLNVAMAALLILTAAMKFPTLGGVVAWIERTARRMREERQLS